MSLPLNQVIVGDCVEVMRTWPVDSIDLVVTSPPYWGLRDYGSETVRVWGGDSECQHEWNEYIFPKRGHPGDKSTLVGTQIAPLSKSIGGTTTNTCVKCGAWRGSLGLEPHPQMFIDHLAEICREIKRVLKPTGTFWINLGDTYGTHTSKRSGQFGKDIKKGFDDVFTRSRTREGFSPNFVMEKNLLGIPWRVAIVLQHEGWILRSDIIWHKPNAMPSSVKDRLSNTYEHVFLFAKRRRYYFDLDAIRQPHKDASLKRYKSPLKIYGNKDDGASRNDFGREMQDAWSPLGKNPGDLWRIPTKPFPAAHFATFPPALIEPIVKAGSPRWICSKCGKPRTRIIETDNPSKQLADDGISGWSNLVGQKTSNPQSVKSLHRNISPNGKTKGVYYSGKTVGWSDCGCGESFDPGVILDPFCGSGTALRVARRLGRRFIGIDIVPEYVEMARRRIRGDKYREPPEGVTPLTQNMEAEGNG